MNLIQENHIHYMIECVKRFHIISILSNSKEL